MTQDMETITIQKGEEKKRANDCAYNQPKWLAVQHIWLWKCTTCTLTTNWLKKRDTMKWPEIKALKKTQEDNGGFKESWYPLAVWAQILCVLPYQRKSTSHRKSSSNLSEGSPNNQSENWESSKGGHHWCSGNETPPTLICEKWNEGPWTPWEYRAYHLTEMYIWNSFHSESESNGHECSESKKAERYFFFPFIKKESLPSSSEESSAPSSSSVTSSASPNPASTSSQFTQELIWIHQEELQRKEIWEYHGPK